MQKGLLFHCPTCNDLEFCAAVPPTKSKQADDRRFHFINHPDINWFRRCRKCSTCESTQITAEVNEEFLNELVRLRAEVVVRNQRAVASLRKRIPWTIRHETIPLKVAQALIRSSAWWYGHPYGPCRAPKHADGIEKNHHGWILLFGANSFLVGKAIERCRNRVRLFLDAIANGDVPDRDLLERQLKLDLRGAVANFDGYEYDGYYPEDNGYMMFGTQAINLGEAVQFLLADLDLDCLILNSASN